LCFSPGLQLEEEEDSFDVDVAVTNPEKVGQSLFFFLFVETLTQLSVIPSLIRCDVVDDL